MEFTTEFIKEKIARGEESFAVTYHIPNLLYEICEVEHASCNLNCPVYELQTEKERLSRDCSCFKDGSKMLKFIKIASYRRLK